MTDKLIVFLDLDNNSLIYYNIVLRNFTLSKTVSKVNMLKSCGQQAVLVDEGADRLTLLLENSDRR